MSQVMPRRRRQAHARRLLLPFLHMVTPAGLSHWPTQAMLAQAGKYDKAVAIMGRNQWWHKLNQVVGQLTPSNAAQAAALRSCAAFFRRGGQTQFAKEAYIKLQDYAVSLLADVDLLSSYSPSV